MKWFKHYTNFREDEGVQLLIEKHGWGGLGRLYTIMELIAKKMDVENNFEPVVKISKRHLKDILGIYTFHLLDIFLASMVHLFSISITSTDDLVTISWPKMRKYKDSHCRKNAQTSAKVPLDKEKEEEKEKEKEKEEDLYKNIRQADEKSSSHQTSKKVKSPKIIYNRETKQFDNLTEEKIKLWEEVYFTVNVRDQLKRMIVWLEAHPGRRAGNEGFIVRWLNNQVDRSDSKPIYNAGEDNGNNRANNFKLETEPKGFFVAIPEDFDDEPAKM